MKILSCVTLLAYVSAFNRDVSFKGLLNVDFSSKGSPITKVVNLMKDMATQLSVEAQEDADAQSTMGCWCESNEKEKSKSVNLANRKIPELESMIQESAAKSAQLKVEIEVLKKQVTKGKAALETATAIRAKERQDFKDREKELVQNSASLKNAVNVMSKVHQAALPQEALVQVRKFLQQHMKQSSSLLNKMLSRRQHQTIASFLEAPNQQVGLLQHKQKAAPSAEIFGVLKNMKEEFETTQKEGAADEEKAQADFNALKSSKVREIKAGEDQISTKTVEQAQAEESNAQAKTDHEDTSAQLEADTAFLNNLKAQCKNFEQDYQERLKHRTEEISAVQETIEMLTSDEAATTFSKSNSFLQLSALATRKSKVTLVRERAALVLQRAGVALGSPRLVALATTARLDAFKKVTAKIEEMIEALKKTAKEEADQKEFCISEFKQNEKETYQKTDIKQDLETKIADLAALSGNLQDEIAVLNKQIADMHLDMKKASENREQENQDFQVTVADQKAAQTILKKAIERLQSVYSAAAASLLQRKGAEKKSSKESKQEPPVKAKSYKRNAGGSGVVAMIETILDESKKVESDALKSDNDNQAAYEEFISDSNKSIAACQEDVTAKTETLAKADGDSTAAKGDLQHTINDLISLGETEASLHKQCDFLTKNYDTRQTKRTQEIESLQQAKYIFAGAKN